MNIGTLRHRITLQQHLTGRDAAGQPLQGWVDVCTLWADVRHQTGKEHIAGAAEVSVVTASIRIRSRAGINPGMRVLYAGAQYDIKAVIPGGGRGEHLDLVCETGANRG